MTDRATGTFAAVGNLKTSQAVTTLWIVLIAGLTVLGSFVFACAAPLAAVAALAALTMKPGEGLALVVVCWIANQVVGFALLNYPHSADSYAWGIAIGLSAILAFVAAYAVTRAKLSDRAAAAAAFAAAFVVDQIGLYAAGLTLAYHGEAFAPAVVAHVLTINLVAYIAFLLITRAAVACSMTGVAGQSAHTPTF